MKRLAIIFIIITVYFGAKMNAFGQKGKPANLPVTSVITDYDSANPAVRYRIGSDGINNGTYANNTVESVVSIMQSTGEWELDTKDSPNRRIFIDLGDPVTTGTQPPFVAGWYPARFVTKCYLLGTNRLNNMPGLNSTLQCPLALSITVGSDTYRIDMNTAWSPGTDDVLITCTGIASNSSNCNRWRIEPGKIYQEQVKNIGRLVRVYTNRGKTVEEFRGNFYLNFKIIVTNP